MAIHEFLPKSKFRGHHHPMLLEQFLIPYYIWQRRPEALSGVQVLCTTHLQQLARARARNPMLRASFSKFYTQRRLAILSLILQGLQCTVGCCQQFWRIWGFLKLSEWSLVRIWSFQAQYHKLLSYLANLKIFCTGAF